VIRTIVADPDDWGLWHAMSPAALADTPTASDTTLTNWTSFGDTERRWPARPGSAAFNLVPSDADIPVGILSATPPTWSAGSS